MSLKEQSLIKIIIFIEMLLPLAFYFSNSSFVLYATIPFTILNAFLIFNKIKVNLTYFLVFSFIFLGLVFSLILNKWDFSIQLFSGLVLLLWNFTISILVVKYEARKIVLCIFCFFVFFIFLKGVVGDFHPDFGNHIFAESSRNYVSAILIVYYIAYAALSFIENKKVSIFATVFLLLSCIILFGRTGIAVSGVLLLYAIYNNYGAKISILFTIFLTGLSSIIYYYAMEYTNFADGLDTPRTLMIREYISSISESEIIFGRNFFQCCETIVAFGPNPHNSFIQLHSLYGLYGISLSILVFLIVLISKNISLTFLLFLIYFRYFFDVLGLFYFLDFSIIIIFLYCLDSILKRGKL